MSPAFAADQRRLRDLKTEWERLVQSSGLLAALSGIDGIGAEQKAWFTNAALSSGVSGLYTGMEGILRNILSLTEEFAASGDNWHQRLLDQASMPLPGVRPAILSEPVYDTLLELRRFRHFERHSYRYRFNEDEVAKNRLRAEEIVPAFIRDVEAFFITMSDP